MRDEKTKFFIYLGGMIIQKGVPFAMLPFYTAALTIKEFGEFSVLISTILFLSIIISMKPESYLVRELNVKGNSEDLPIRNSLAVLCINSLFVLPFVYLFSLDFLGIYIENQWLVNWVVVFVLFVYSAKGTVEGYMIAKGKSIDFVRYQAFQAILIAIFSFLLLKYFSFGVLGRLLPEFIVSVLVLLFFLNYISNYISFSKLKGFNLKDVYYLFIPMMLHSLGFTFLLISDRIMLQKMIGSESVALYTVAYTFGLLSGVIHEVFMKVWSPFFYKNVADTVFERSKLLPAAFIYSVISLIYAFVFSYIINQFYQDIVPMEYHSIGVLIYIISLSFSFEGTRKVFSSYIIASNKYKYIALLSIFTVCVNVLINLWLIPEFEEKGAAVATLVSFLIMSFVTVLIALSLRKAQGFYRLMND